MAYPSTIDSLTTKTDNVDIIHAADVNNLQTAVVALETKVGVDSSAVTSTHDYKLGEILTTDKAVGKSATQTLTNKTLTAPTVTGATITTSTVNGVTLQTAGSSSDFLAANGSYVAGSVSNASTTAKGIVEAATSAEVTAGTATGGTGAVLVVTPDALAASTPVFNGSALTSLPSTVYYATASNNLKLSADTERSKATSGLTLVKSIRPSFGGVVRITHDMKGSSGSSQVESRIYLNGVAAGTSRTYIGTTYQSYSEDITINPGDQVQLYYAGDSGFAISCFVRNFRLSFDTTSAGNGYTITD